MEIVQKSKIQNSPLKEHGNISSKKRISNGNYLTRKTTPLNSILNAIKGANYQDLALPVAKVALAVVGTVASLGLIYLAYQCFGTNNISSFKVSRPPEISEPPTISTFKFSTLEMSPTPSSTQNQILNYVVAIVCTTLFGYPINKNPSQIDLNSSVKAIISYYSSFIV